MEKEIAFKNDSGEQLSGYLHLPKKYAHGIVLSHCFTCSKHIKVIRAMCEYLAETGGYAVLRFDFTGNGESEGKFEESTYSKQVGDHNAAVAFLKKQKVKKIGALGHSMGAAVTIIDGTKHPDVSALVTLAGDSSTEGIERAFDKKIVRDIKTKGMCTFKVFNREVTLTKEFFNDARTHSLKQLLNESKKPIHIIHGTKDEIIPSFHARKLYRYANEPKKITLIDGGDHMFTNNLEQTLDLACDWFRMHLK